MKKPLLRILLLLIAVFPSRIFAQRYLTEVFTATTTTSNVVYGQNIQVYLTPTADTVSLKADVYEPVGDTLTARPTVIVIHTGSFLPILFNRQTTGIKTDSAVVEMCKQFARRGYTAIAMDYRLGWNPSALGAAGQEIRTGTLLQAVGRALQDAKACVRYFRNNALNTNDYKIDESRIILGGMGSGGYVALAYGTVDNYADISLTKFIALSDNPTYGFTTGVTFFDSTIWGNTDGYGGMPGRNISTNTPGVSNDIAFVFNMGGAMGDISWLEAGNVPMVCFHVKNDPFAPYGDGPVIVPTTGDFVVDVSGSETVIRVADSLNNNINFQNNTWTDPYTTRANQVNEGNDGLFPIEVVGPPPFFGQAGVWEWYDSVTIYNYCMLVLGFTQGHTDSIWYGSLATNPDMSRTKGMAYIDTVMGYLNPRIVSVINVGINESPLPENMVSVYPNPSSGYFNVKVAEGIQPILYINIYDVSGRLVYSESQINRRLIRITTKDFESGLYSMSIGFDTGEIKKKISVR